MFLMKDKQNHSCTGEGVEMNDTRFRLTRLYKGPINGPCSACGDGDTAMKYHDHEPPSPSYMLADLERLAEQWAIENKILATERWNVSCLLAWLQRKEREANG